MIWWNKNGNGDRMNKILRCFVFTGWLVSGIHLFALGVQDKDSFYNQETRACLYELQNAEKIDVLFLGGSHIFYGINPEITDKEWAVESFDASTVSQKPIDSYYLLQDILKNGTELSVVVLDANYISFQRLGNIYEGTFPVLQYIKSTSVKGEYAYKALKDISYMFDDVSVMLRYKENWKDMKKVLKNIYGKVFDQDYRMHRVRPKGQEEYRGKGYIYSERRLADYEYRQLPWTEKNRLPESEAYFDRLIEECRKNDLKVILVSVPIHKEYTNREPFYRDVVKFFSEKAEEHAIPYYNFQSMYDEIGLQDEDFIDVQHLNGKGAQKFTVFLCEMLREEFE